MLNGPRIERAWLADAIYMDHGYDISSALRRSYNRRLKTGRERSEVESCWRAEAERAISDLCAPGNRVSLERRVDSFVGRVINSETTARQITRCRCITIQRDVPGNVSGKWKSAHFPGKTSPFAEARQHRLFSDVKQSSSCFHER